MLPFLREQGTDDSLTQKSSKNSGKSPDDNTQTAQEQQYIAVSSRGKNARKSTLMLVILFAIGLVCLWFMIKKSSPQKASAQPAGTEESQIESAITRLTGVKSEMFSRMDEILKKFYEFSDVLQVDTKELIKNPFELELFLANLRAKLATEEKTPIIGAEILMQQQIAEAIKGIKLLSIMQSESDDGRKESCCMIDYKVLHEQDSIRGFKVSQIGNNFVKLRWMPTDNAERSVNQLELPEIVLKLSE